MVIKAKSIHVVDKQLGGIHLSNENIELFKQAGMIRNFDLNKLTPKE